MRLLPPPSRFAAVLLRWAPRTALERAFAGMVNWILADSFTGGALDTVIGRRLAVEATDVPLRWVVEVAERRIEVLDPLAEAEATVRASSADLLLLVGRAEDADTLFFQRRLQLTGDVELGLTVRNLLDQLPWESIPLALRIPLNRIARLLQATRQAEESEGRPRNGPDAARPGS